MSSQVYAHPGVAGLTGSGLTGDDTDYTVIDSVAPANSPTGGDDPAIPLLTLTIDGLGGTSQFVGGSTANLAGRFRTPAGEIAAFYLEDIASRTVRQWSGKAPVELTNSIKAGTAGWTALGSGKFSKNIGAGLSLVDVTADFFDPANFDSVGRPKSHYLGVALGSVVGGGAQGTYNYTSPTLTIGTHGSWDPRTPVADGLAYELAGTGGFAAVPLGGASDTITPNITVSGLRLSCCGDETLTYPAAIYIQSGDNCLISSNIMRSVRRHGISFGSRVTNNTTRSNTVLCMTENSTGHVFDALGTTAGQPNQVTNCIAENDVVYANSLLGHDGKYVARCFSLGGFYAHGNIHDVEWKNCQVIEYSQPGGAAADVVLQIDCAQEDTVPLTPADPYNPETYPARVRQTDPAIRTVENACFSPNQGIVTHLAQINNRRRYTQFAAVSNGNCLDYSSRKGIILLYGGELVANMNNSGRDMGLIAVGPNSRIICIGMSFYDPTASSHGAFKYGVFNFTAARKTIDQITTGAAPVFRTTAAHGLKVGTTVKIRTTNSTPVVDGTYVVATVPDTTHFTVTGVATVTVAGTAGTVLGIGKVEFYGCIFGFRDTAGGGSRKLIFGDSLTEYDDHSHLAGSGNFTYNVTSYSDNANFSSEANFRSLVDPLLAAPLGANPFVNVDGSTLDLTTAAKLLIVPAGVPYRALRGANGRAGPQPGAYLYGGDSLHSKGSLRSLGATSLHTKQA